MSLGSKISAIRHSQKLTIRDVAMMSGVTASLISQIEHDKANPSLSTLHALAKALNTSLPALFSEESEALSPVVRSTERPMFKNAKGFAGYILTNQDYDRFSVHLSILQPQASSDHSPELNPRNATGYEFAYILSGKASIQLGETLYVLNPGDTISFEADRPHTLSNVHNGETEILWVMIH